MGRRGRRRAGSPQEPASSSEYRDAEGNVLALRDRLSRGTLKQLSALAGAAGASQEDVWQRCEELLFERLAVSWTIAGLPLSSQKELLGRYRLASADERDWVRRTIAEHLERHIPELA